MGLEANGLWKKAMAGVLFDSMQMFVQVANFCSVSFAHEGGMQLFCFILCIFVCVCVCVSISVSVCLCGFVYMCAPTGQKRVIKPLPLKPQS